MPLLYRLVTFYFYTEIQIISELNETNTETKITGELNKGFHTETKIIG